VLDPEGDEDGDGYKNGEDIDPLDPNLPQDSTAPIVTLNGNATGRVLQNS
jgi:hypothetical protein